MKRPPPLMRSRRVSVRAALLMDVPALLDSDASGNPPGTGPEACFPISARVTTLRATIAATGLPRGLPSRNGEASSPAPPPGGLVPGVAPFLRGWLFNWLCERGS